MIILKPNLTNSSPPPVTSSVEFTAAVYHYLKEKTRACIAIGEGCGYGTTATIFRKQGYTRLAEDEGIELIDFNSTETVTLRNEGAFSLRSFHLPVVLQEAWLVSLPVLKDHSFTRTTISMKNLFGIAPGRFYKGSWNKSKIHSPSADLWVGDAVTALTGSHLSERPKKLDTIIAGFDPVAVDAVRSALLGYDPRKLKYLRKADGIIGSMQGIDLKEI